MYDRINQREITNPHLLTKTALKVIRGKPVLRITDEDYESIMQYYERQTIVDKICKDVFTHFNI